MAQGTIHNFITTLSKDEAELNAQCARRKTVALIVGVWVLLLLAIYWVDKKKLLNDFSLLTEVAGTLVGIAISFWMLRPRMHIDELRLHMDNSGEHVSLRFENIGLWDIYDIEVEMQSYSYDDNKERVVDDIDLVESNILCLRSIFSKWTNRSYLLISKDPVSQIKLIDDCEGIRCRISGTNAFSGIRYVYEKEFIKQ